MNSVRLSRRSLTDLGVDVSASRTVAGATEPVRGGCWSMRAAARRTVLWDRHPALATDPADVSKDAVTSGRVLIVDCHEAAAAAQAARFAREAGIPTIIDVEKVRPAIAELLQQIDAIIAAQEFPTALTGYENLGEALAAIGREFKTPLVCVDARGRGQSGVVQRTRNPHARVPGSIAWTARAQGTPFRGGFAAACPARTRRGCRGRAGLRERDRQALNCRVLGGEADCRRPARSITSWQPSKHM
jgi:sugar/nucleoside kinase (ribokinase family)